jgi:hypothetical protein
VTNLTLGPEKPERKDDHWPVQPVAPSRKVAARVRKSVKSVNSVLKELTPLIVAILGAALTIQIIYNGQVYVFSSFA